jgi:Skp family chaperone for outer membrane proteins
VAEEQRIVKGGFRANLALLISIVALVLSIVAYQRTGGQADLESRIKTLNEKMKTMKVESADRMNTIIQDTKKGLEKLSIEIEKKGRRLESEREKSQSESQKMKEQ